VTVSISWKQKRDSEYFERKKQQEQTLTLSMLLSLRSITILIKQMAFAQQSSKKKIIKIKIEEEFII
jgi:hypothetical protein